MSKRHNVDNQAPSRPVVLAIGGFDPSGGAGILLDAYAIRAAGVFPAAVTAVTTVQDGNRFIFASKHEAGEVASAAALMLERFPTGAVKTGALGSVEILLTLSDLARRPDFPADSPAASR